MFWIKFRIFGQLQGRLNPKVPLNIEHLTSEQEPALQATDLFSWGIFRKYEKGDESWIETYQEKVKFDEMYL